MLIYLYYYYDPAVDHVIIQYEFGTTAVILLLFLCSITYRKYQIVYRKHKSNRRIKNIIICNIKYNIKY